METIDRAPRFSFPTKEKADEFCKKLRVDGLKYDVVTINDVIRKSGNPLPYGLMVDGYKYGYSRKEIKKFKPEKAYGNWIVRMPIPGKMVRDPNGYWTTDAQDPMDIPDKTSEEILGKMRERLKKDAEGG